MAILRRASTASASDPFEPAVDGYTRRLPQVSPDARLEERIRQLDQRIARLERRDQLVIDDGLVLSDAPVLDPEDAPLGALLYSPSEHRLWIHLPDIGWMPMSYVSY